MVAHALAASDIARLAAWERTSDGRWWCTECQSRNGRTPLLHWKMQRAADPNVDNLRRLQAEAERWVRLDRMFMWALVAVLIGGLAVVLVLAIT